MFPETAAANFAVAVDVVSVASVPVWPVPVAFFPDVIAPASLPVTAAAKGIVALVLVLTIGETDLWLR